jgi:hypothetical protein
LTYRRQTTLFVECEWNPATHNQAEDRAHRYGQDHDVRVDYLALNMGNPYSSDATMWGNLFRKSVVIRKALGDSPSIFENTFFVQKILRKKTKKIGKLGRVDGFSRV